MKKILKLLSEARPEIIGGLIVAGALALINWIFDFVNIWVFFEITLGCIIWGLSAYVAFSYSKNRRRSKLVRRAREWNYPQLRPYALAMFSILTICSIGWIGSRIYNKIISSHDLVILVADFDGPDPKNYRVAEIILSQLETALAPYSDVKIEPLGYAFNENQTRDVIRTAGEKHNAAIVIWGWYGLTNDKVVLSYHFEIMSKLENQPQLCTIIKDPIRYSPEVELEGFTLQTDLSEELTYLSLVTVGLARYSLEDWDGAISRFNSALQYYSANKNIVPPSEIYYYRGSALFEKGDGASAIKDLNQAIFLDPNYAHAYLRRAGIYLEKEKKYSEAISDYTMYLTFGYSNSCMYVNLGRAYYYNEDYQNALLRFDIAIEADPDNYSAYNWRGFTYEKLDKPENAILDYERVWRFSTNYEQRQYALSRLRELNDTHEP